MSVDHRRLGVGVPEQFLYCAQVIAVLKEMRRKGMPKRMRADLLRNADIPHRLGQRTLYVLFVPMVTAFRSAPERGTIERWRRRLQSGDSVGGKGL